MSKTVKTVLKQLNQNFEYKSDIDKTIFNGDIEVIQSLHGTEFMPDDFRYNTLMSLVETLLEYSADTIDRLETYRHEIVDGRCSIYTQGLLDWVASNQRRTDYVDQAMRDFDCEDLAKALLHGQRLELSELYDNIVAYVESVVTNE